MAVVQAVTTGGVLFLFYRYLLKAIGPEQVGVWAVVLATASTSRISEMGFTGSAVKFTAKYVARGEPNQAAEVVQTTYITIGVLVVCVLAGGYPLILWILGKLVQGGQKPVVPAILPIALLSVWISSVSGVFLAGLDGCQRIDLRSVTSILGGLVLLGLTWLLVDRFGLTGLAWAQVGQGVSVLLGSRIFLQRELSSLPWFPRRWCCSLFKEMFRYGVNFQINVIFTMLFEPTTKMLMTIFGGLTATGYYEMANRMVVQFRSLLVSAIQVIVPRVATFQEMEPERIRNAYSESYRILFYLSPPLFAGVAACTPLASVLWLGRYEPSFVTFTLLLTLGWWLNTHNVPAYFVNLGTGLLLWNTVGHVTTGVLNIILGYVFGYVLGSVGVVLGYVLALSIGSSLVVIKYHLDNHVPFRMLIPYESQGLLACCFFGLLTGWIIIHYLNALNASMSRAGLSVIIFMLAVVPAFWMHPVRRIICLKAAFAFGKPPKIQDV